MDLDNMHQSRQLIIGESHDNIEQGCSFSFQLVPPPFISGNRCCVVMILLLADCSVIIFFVFEVVTLAEVRNELFIEG